MTDNMSSASQFALFVLAAYTIVATLGDAWTSSLCFGYGLREMNPVNEYLFTKISQLLMAFLGALAVLFACLITSVYSPTASFVYLGSIAALETVMSIRNYKLLKASKIKFWLPF